jgi:uncharacterized protein YraI
MNTRARSFRQLFAAILIILIIMVSVGAGWAQGGPVFPIAVGENIPGEITATTAAPSFALTVTAPQDVVVQVLGLTSGFIPTFSVVSPSGVAIINAPNAINGTVASANVSLPSAGTYLIQVGSSGNTPGQFILSIQGGAPIAPPQPISAGQAISGQVDNISNRQSYSFPGSATQILLLSVNVQTATNPVVTLRDQDTNEVLSQNSARLSGLQFRIPMGAFNYVVHITHSGAPAAERFTVCLAVEGGTFACPGSPVVVLPTAIVVTSPPTPQRPTATPVLIPPTGVCSVATSGATPVNLRSGPSTAFSVLGQLVPGILAPVTGRLADSTWYQVNASGLIAWVSSSVVQIGGQCATVPILPSFTPTAVPTGATPPSATFTPTTVLSTATPTATSAAPTAVPTLNYSLPPTFGSTSLTAGFVPDPFSVGITSGGVVDTSYLGSGCYGFAAVAPDFSVNYTSGGASLLRFYFIGSGDTTMIINTPGGSYVCVDDSFGTLNPTIDFNSPSSGRYDVWIGSYSQGAFVPGTLFVTELSGNHP